MLTQPLAGMQAQCTACMEACQCTPANWRLEGSLEAAQRSPNSPPAAGTGSMHSSCRVVRHGGKQVCGHGDWSAQEAWGRSRCDHSAQMGRLGPPALAWALLPSPGPSCPLSSPVGGRPVYVCVRLYAPVHWLGVAATHGDDLRGRREEGKGGKGSATVARHVARAYQPAYPPLPRSLVLPPLTIGMPFSRAAE